MSAGFGPSSAASRAIREFEPGDEAAVLEVIRATLRADQIPGLTFQDLASDIARIPAHPGRTIVASEDGLVVGFCFLVMHELFVHPSFRRRGHGRRIVEALLALLQAEGEEHLQLHGPDLAAAGGFRDALGFRYHSSLWMFELGASVAVPPPVFPAGILARTYEDRDLVRLVDVAAASFADHVTPIAFTEEIVSQANSLPGFDRRGILLLFDRADPDAAIAWAKAKHGLVESTGERRATVSMVGVRPAWRGRGLGRELLRWSIAYGRTAGAATTELYVEAANEAAKQLYLATGFEPVVEWPQYVLPTGA